MHTRHPPEAFAASAHPRLTAAELMLGAGMNGMLLLSCGQSTIRFMPPLMVTKEHVDEAIVILDASLGETLTA